MIQHVYCVLNKWRKTESRKLLTSHATIIIFLVFRHRSQRQGQCDAGNKSHQMVPYHIVIGVYFATSAQVINHACMVSIEQRGIFQMKICILSFVVVYNHYYYNINICVCMF
jgi:hypothetical protein